MSKSSVVTSRQTPMASVSSVAAGGLVIHSETFSIQTTERVEIIDLTERIMAHVRQFPVREGVISLWSMHTTCALFINESQPALMSDITRFIEEFAPQGAPYLHNDPAHSDCSRANADSHLRAMLLGHSLSLQISGGEVVLGQWQRVLMAELDGARIRTLRVQIMGVA
jgi:secondary thiamine-phosphate synthase enzyme